MISFKKSTVWTTGFSEKIQDVATTLNFGLFLGSLCLMAIKVCVNFGGRLMLSPCNTPPIALELSHFVVVEILIVFHEVENITVFYQIKPASKFDKEGGF